MPSAARAHVPPQPMQQAACLPCPDPAVRTISLIVKQTQTHMHAHTHTRARERLVLSNTRTHAHARAHSQVVMRLVVTAAAPQLEADPDPAASGPLSAVLPPGGRTGVRVVLQNTGNLGTGCVGS